MPTEKEIIELLETVLDPEIGIDIYTLGLIYKIEILSESSVHITMTYTTPMCPAGPIIQHEIRDALSNIGIESVQSEIVFDPPWKPSDELRTMLGI